MTRTIICSNCGRPFEANRNENVLSELREGEKTAAEIARNLRITHSGALWILNHLIRDGKVERKDFHGMGYIYRIPTDPLHQRPKP